MEKVLHFHSVKDLSEHLKKHVPTFYFASQTSTVIPYEKIRENLNPNTILGNLSSIKGELSWHSADELKIRGNVTWKEAKEFCRSQNREIMTSPTEELAAVLSGVATSCTGERSFGFSNLRSQIVSLKYLNFEGEEKELSASKKLNLNIDLVEYQNDFSKFQSFKNAPYPRFQFETDLMTGTEGQLGVITEAVIKTIPYEEETYLFFLVPKWEDDYSKHLEIYHAVQSFRGRIRACELIDSNSINYLPQEKRIGDNQDLIFVEITKKDFDGIYEELIAKLKIVEVENIFEIDSTKCRELRMSVPRAIFEENTRMGVTKKGTDAQVDAKHFEELLKLYRDFTKLGVKYNMFGHFGDGHLHFNFMPTPDQDKLCLLELHKLYSKILAWNCSPFAEHGIGLLKKVYMPPFYKEVQRQAFASLKKEFDPHNQFFPEGFMHL